MSARWLLTAAALATVSVSGVALLLPRQVRARLVDLADRLADDLRAAVEAAWSDLGEVAA